MSVVALLSIVAGSASAQVAAPSSPCSYEDCALRHVTKLFSEELVRGATSERVAKFSLGGGSVADYLSRVELAAAPARDFKTRRTRAAYLGILSGAAVGWVASELLIHDDSEPTTTQSVVLFGGLGFGILGGIEATRSRNSLSRAIWEFNRAPVR